MARIVGRVLGISYKASIEICNTIRGKEAAKAKKILNDIISKKVPIRFSRFTNGAGHKKSVGPGKYPLKAAKEILKLVETAEANAQFQGLNTSNLKIVHISAQKGGNQWRYGRVRRRRMKRTTIEVVIEEGKKENKKIAKEKLTEDSKVQKKEVKKNIHKNKETEKLAEEKYLKQEGKSVSNKKGNTGKKIIQDGKYVKVNHKDDAEIQTSCL